MPYGSVLVVDDVEANIYVARGLLAPYGLTVDSSGRALTAIEKIRQGKVYDIVFMDHMRPEMDGMEATKVLRGLGYTRPVVALTANAVTGQAEIFRQNGFDDFLSKPIDLREMNAVLNRFVRDRHPPEVVEAARRQHNDAQESDNDETASLNPKLAKIFIRDASKTVAALEALCAKQDAYSDEELRIYVINVHGMKSPLASIGEAELSALASRLEQAGRERDAAVIASQSPAFLDALREVIQKITPREDGEDSGMTDADQAYLREKLGALKTACAAYNKKAARDALAGIAQKTWPRQTQERLDVIAERLLHSKFKEIARLADEVLESIS
jgi:CheY-like chemotaxis protein